jgi:exodeoxyribonuclease VII large subunit
MFRERMNMGFTNVENMLLDNLRKNEKTKIVVVTGNDSIVDRDFNKELGEMDSQYNVIFQRVNIMSSENIIDKIGSIGKLDCSLLVFMRGGGSGLEVFYDIALCRKTLKAGLPFATAVEYEKDKPALSKLAERSFCTVCPKTQGIYIGCLLATAALQAAFESGTPKVYLENSTGLKAAINLYQELGFQKRYECPAPINGLISRWK